MEMYARGYKIESNYFVFPFHFHSFPRLFLFFHLSLFRLLDTNFIYIFHAVLMVPFLKQSASPLTVWAKGNSVIYFAPVPRNVCVCEFFFFTFVILTPPAFPRVCKFKSRESNLSLSWGTRSIFVVLYLCLLRRSEN